MVDFNALIFLKRLHDNHILVPFLADLGETDLDIVGDLEDHLIRGVVEIGYYTEEYLEDWETLKSYYSSASMDDYFWLAKEYGHRHNLPEEKNPYFEQAKTYMNEQFLHDYNFDWMLVTNTHKPHASGIVAFRYPEFYDNASLFFNYYAASAHFKEEACKLRSLMSEEADGLFVESGVAA